MTFDEYEREVETAYHINPTWRWGQAYFNVLEYYRPDLAKTVRGTSIDPFHMAYAPFVFLTAVRENW